ncbi:MAG: hypothetical protein KC777_13240 [Cyanobacteria bacterium HKST-UBA02]|nr:hypothetical protein [Candidatus Melainabacteria bacterium]MCA9802929.1 hypothetical protein [Cyanobacteria bacterium HKST-UBA02]
MDIDKLLKGFKNQEPIPVELCAWNVLKEVVLSHLPNRTEAVKSATFLSQRVMADADVYDRLYQDV